MSLEKTEAILREYSKNLTFQTACPDLPVEAGVATWDVTHNLSTTNVVAGLFNPGNQEIDKTMQVLTPNKVRIVWNTSLPSVTAGDFNVLVVSGGATNGLTIDTMLSMSSMNAVQNAVITEAVQTLDEALHNLNSGTGAE